MKKVLKSVQSSYAIRNESFVEKSHTQEILYLLTRAKQWLTRIKYVSKGTGVRPCSYNSPNLAASDTQFTNTDGRALTDLRKKVGRLRTGR